jgi:choline-glycine betaine transporter
MSEPSIDSGIIAKLVDWVWAIIAGLMAIVWKANERKLEVIQSHIDSKASQVDVRRALEHIETIYKAMENDREKHRDRFDKVMAQQHQQYEHLINIINDKRHGV